jgi:hypothetical protein
MSSTAEVVFCVLVALFLVKMTYHVAVGVVHFRGGIRGVPINISPVLFPDPFLILGITWLWTDIPEPRVRWPVVLLILTIITVWSYQSWGALYRLGVALGSRGSHPKGVSSA